MAQTRLAGDAIRIEGLAEFNRSLRAMDKDLPKGLRLALNDAGEIVVKAAKPEVPVKTGRAAASLKTKSTRTMARVTGGSSSVPYYPWLDFGGAVGRQNSVHRPYITEGRYIYPSFVENAGDVNEALEDALTRVARDAGIQVT